MAATTTITAPIAALESVPKSRPQKAACPTRQLAARSLPACSFADHGADSRSHAAADDGGDGRADHRDRQPNDRAGDGADERAKDRAHRAATRTAGAPRCHRAGGELDDFTGDGQEDEHAQTGRSHRQPRVSRRKPCHGRRPRPRSASCPAGQRASGPSRLPGPRRSRATAADQRRAVCTLSARPLVQSLDDERLRRPRVRHVFVQSQRGTSAPNIDIRSRGPRSWQLRKRKPTGSTSRAPAGGACR